MLKISMYRVQKEYKELRPGGHWFSPSAMKFFNSHLPEIAYMQGNDFYFISSEKYNYDSERLYTIRKLDGKTGDIETIGPFNELTKTQARRELATILNCKVKDL